MITAVDTNVFLSILIGEGTEGSIAQEALTNCRAQGNLITSVICYAELTRQFLSRAELDGFLLDLECKVVSLDSTTAFLGGQYFMRYRERGGDKIRVIADFLIAADAQINADRLLTSDKRFFGESFSDLNVVSPVDMSRL